MTEFALRAAPPVPGRFDGEAPISVAMMTNLFAPVASGSATQSMGLAAALAARGHRVVVITAQVDSNSATHERIDGYDVYRVPALRLPKMSISLNFPWLNWTLWPANLKRMEGILREHSVQVIHIHNHMFDMAFAGVILGRRLGLLTVITIHTIIKHSKKFFNLLLAPADRYALKHMVIRNADAVICPDVNVETYVRQRFGLTDSYLIPYGIDLPPHPGRMIDAEIREKFGLDGKRVILSLGHVHALRNRIDLVKAMPKVLDKFPNAVLLIVGAVADQRPVALANQLKIEQSVIFAGAQPHGHMPVYHSLAEIEAMWFDQADGGMNPLGIACMEGMFAGKPVLTVSNEDTFGRGVLKSGRDLWIIEAGQPERVAELINDLLSDTEKALAMGRHARVIATEHFAWENIAACTLRIYRSLLTRKSPAVIKRDAEIGMERLQ
jgi:glycosyltransferase involved in cell wall biosynthesis